MNLFKGFTIYDKNTGEIVPGRFAILDTGNIYIKRSDNGGCEILPHDKNNDGDSRYAIRIEMDVMSKTNEWLEY